MAWCSAERCWSVQFSSIKLPYGVRTGPAFDDLYLVVMSPEGLHRVKCDLVTRVSSCGKATRIGGHMIRVYESRHTYCWEDALEGILEKLCQQSGGTVAAEKPLSEVGVKAGLSEEVPQGQVAGLPMSSMSKEKRGNRIQEIGLEIDRRLHSQNEFSFLKGNRSKSNASADWARGKVLVELKSCGLNFNRARELWQCRFANIKPTYFDELWLSIYTHFGIHYYRSKRCNSLPYCQAGAATNIRGNSLTFCGPRGGLDPLEAFKTIQAKMICRGCELVAIVEWE